MTIGIHRLRNVQTAWFLADNRRESSPKRATWNAKSVIRKSDRRLGCKECDWADWSIACHGLLLSLHKNIKNVRIIEGSFPIMQTYW